MRDAGNKTILPVTTFIIFFSFIRVLFEKIIPERTQVDAEQFMKSGSYLYLRSGLVMRWNVLAKLHTYPNMIKPLNIN